MSRFVVVFLPSRQMLLHFSNNSPTRLVLKAIVKLFVYYFD